MAAPPRLERFEPEQCPRNLWGLKAIELVEESRAGRVTHCLGQTE